jgi:hypothetical protein
MSTIFLYNKPSVWVFFSPSCFYFLFRYIFFFFFYCLVTLARGVSEQQLTEEMTSFPFGGSLETLVALPGEEEK